MHKILTVLFGIILVGVLFLEVDARFLNNSEVVIVEMTASGFVPSRVAVPEGGAIKFVNVDTETHWPAVNIHPIHSSYPGSDIRKCSTPEEMFIFDACRPIEPGESYTFLFRQSGGWGFHDHIVPRFFGGVDVTPVEGYEPPPVPPSVIAWRFFNTIVNLNSPDSIRGLDLFRGPSSTLQLGRYSKEKLISSKDYEEEIALDTALNDLEIRRMITQLGVERTVQKAFAEAISLSRTCHREMHYIGRAAYDLYGVQGVTECDESCVFGCYHGAMETMFADLGAGASSELENLCGGLDTVYGRYQCFHGIGHGFLTFLRTNLPEALNACETLSTDEAREACYGGVFMENSAAAFGQSVGNEGHVSEWASWTDFNYPCSLFVENPTIQKWCYEFQGGWIYVALGHDFDAAAVECNEGVPLSMRSTCFQGLGRNYAGHIRYDPVATESFCASVSPEYYGDCILGASRVHIDYLGPTVENNASEFCSGLPNKEAQQICHTSFIQRVSDFFSSYDEKSQLCSRMENPYKEQCFTSIEES